MEYKSRNNIRALVILVVPLEMVLSYWRNDFGDVFSVGASTFAGDVGKTWEDMSFPFDDEDMGRGFPLMERPKL